MPPGWPSPPILGVGAKVKDGVGAGGRVGAGGMVGAGAVSEVPHNGEGFV